MRQTAALVEQTGSWLSHKRAWIKRDVSDEDCCPQVLLKVWAQNGQQHGSLNAFVKVKHGILPPLALGFY